jgi:predicted HAD superfamily Cof-like phosphohydrolase
MQEQLNKVATFHRVFKQKDGTEPQLLPENDFLLRHTLMAEENEEYLEACKQKDMIEIADALGDQLYILCGTILKHGMQNIIEDVFNEIQESNMSKLDENGEPLFREDGKIMKSNKYFPPNIARILNK